MTWYVDESSRPRPISTVGEQVRQWWHRGSTHKRTPPRPVDCRQWRYTRHPRRHCPARRPAPARRPPPWLGCRSSARRSSPSQECHEIWNCSYYTLRTGPKDAGYVGVAQKLGSMDVQCPASWIVAMFEWIQLSWRQSGGCHLLGRLNDTHWQWRCVGSVPLRNEDTSRPIRGAFLRQPYSFTATYQKNTFPVI